MKSVSRRFRELLINDNKRVDVQQSVLFLLLSVVSAVMTVLNIFTRKGALTWATAAFAVLCLVDYLLHRRGGWAHRLALVLFVLEVSALFNFFIISGNPDGFSVLWIAMLPSFGLLMFRRRYGTLFSAFLLAQLIFYLWTPWGSSLLQYDYNPTFRMRFPVLYTAFFALDFFLEVIREITYDEMKKARDRYSFLSLHDPLTGTYNRGGFMQIVGRGVPEDAALALLDVDGFKQINDTYGHTVGDRVLKELSAILCRRMSGRGDVCRWGGDEFALLFRAADGAEATCRSLLDEVRAAELDVDGTSLRFRISVGLAYPAPGGLSDAEQLIHRADEKLYAAKSGGRDRLEAEPAPRA